MTAGWIPTSFIFRCFCFCSSTSAKLFLIYTYLPWNKFLILDGYKWEQKHTTLSLILITLMQYYTLITKLSINYLLKSVKITNKNYFIEIESVWKCHKKTVNNKKQNAGRKNQYTMLMTFNINLLMKYMFRTHLSFVQKMIVTFY